MTSFQSTLGEEAGIADELAENQRQISIAEFFEKNKHMLGFDSGARGLVTAVKEGVDNALDACEEADISPDIFVDISEMGDYYEVVIEDNGPGITAEQVPKVFGKLLYGSRFHAREQNRGQQGIGISAAVLYSQLTSGKPARITSRPKGEEVAKYFELIIDTDTNEPEIRTAEETTWDRPHGTRIELEMEANMRARSQLHEYMEETAIVNPHARVELREPGLDDPLKFERATDQLPAETEEIQPHPHGVELGTLIKMLEATESYSVSGFLQGEFTRVGAKTADKVISAFRDRHYGRALQLAAPAAHESVDLARAVQDAVANKGADATASFADRVATRIQDASPVAHHQVRETITTVADDIETEYDTTFGDTVRRKARAAAWAAITDDDDRLRSDLYGLIDGVTTTRKDDAAIDGLAGRLAEKLTDAGEAYRFTREQMERLVDDAADLTEEYDEATFGDTAREKVTDAVWDRTTEVPDEPPKVREIAASRDTASQLLEAMRATDILAPPTECLAPITSELVEAGLQKEFDAEFFAAATRDAEVHGGDPFIVEAGIAYGGELSEGGIDVLRFANRVPLVYQRGACATTDVVKSIGWRNYGLDQPGGSGIPQGPAVVMVHVASTNVPFTSESKDAIANVPAIEDEIELAIREAARELKSFLNERRSLRKRRQKQDVLGRILPEMAEKVAEVTERNEPEIGNALARIMNNVAVDATVADDAVVVTAANHTDSSETPEVTAIVDEEPTDEPEGATTVEMDGEWFVSWEPALAGGEETQLRLAVAGEPTVELSVDGVTDEKLTVNEP